MVSAIVTKKSVKYAQDKLNIITFNFILKDNDIEVINQDVSCEYRKGEAPSQKVAEIVEKINLMISRYKAEQVIFNAAVLDTAVASINAGVIL
jgi:hypothetical protein